MTTASVGLSVALVPERTYRWRCWRCGHTLGEHNYTPGAWFKVHCHNCDGREGAYAVNVHWVDQSGHVRSDGWLEPKRRR